MKWDLTKWNKSCLHEEQESTCAPIRGWPSLHPTMGDQGGCYTPSLFEVLKSDVHYLVAKN